MVAETAKARVPVLTGRLRDAIHVDVELGVGTYVVAGTDQIWYGLFVEHGTRHAPAHPFLLPALEENRATIEAEVIGAIRRVSE